MTTKLLLLAAFIASMFFMSFNFSKKKKKIIFFGDSITQEAVRPIGYISQLQHMLKQEGIEDKYELTGAGIGGNKVYDLFLRMDNDVLAKGPDIVVIYIGVNDVWHKRTHGTGTDADKFEKFYNAIIDKMQAAGIKVVLCTPAVIGEKTDNSNELDGDLNKYSQMIRDIAAREQLPLVDLRKVFFEYNLANNPLNHEMGILTRDRVHLNEKGNQLVADEMWKVLQTLK